MNVNENEEDYTLNINSAISKKVIFEMNSERAKKRMLQMKKRKEMLNETDSLKYEKSTFSSTVTPLQNEDSQNKNINYQNNEIINKNEKIILNPFLENEKSENENSEIEVNISDLECNIEIEKNEEKKNNNIIDISSSEYAKNYCHSYCKSFIHLNNNLVAKAALQKEKNTPSYILALCPEILRKNINNKEIICENYAVDDAINEENEIETPNKSKFINYNSDNFKSNNSKNNSVELDKNINNNKNNKRVINYKEFKIKGIHKKSKSGFCYNNILRTNSIEYKKNPVFNRMGNNSNNKNKKNSHLINSLFDNKYYNTMKFPKNKTSIIFNSTREIEMKKNINKNIQCKNDNLNKNIKNNKSISINSFHKKSKTVFTNPSFINPIFNFNTLRNNSSSNKISPEKKNKNQFNEVKKEIKYIKSFNKTYGVTLPKNLNNKNNNKINFNINNLLKYK
jgi:hypothetical protein